MKIIVGNLTSTLETDNPKILSALRDKYSFPVPGHEYSQAYKKRRWDGKKRYFGARIVTACGCLKIYSIGLRAHRIIVSEMPIKTAIKRLFRKISAASSSRFAPCS